MKFEVKNILSGGIMVTYYCSVNCAHCRHNASPKRASKFISEELLSKVLQKLSAVGCSSVHLEGGEPFLFPKELVRAVKQISDSDIQLEHIVTNCSWYRNQKDTTNLLKELQANGMNRMVLKVGPFQNESIPLRKVQNVKQAAELLGINIVIWDSEFYPEVAAFDPSKKHSLKKYIKKYGEDYILRCAQRFNVTFTGRSFDAYKKHLPKVSTQELLNNKSLCCLQNLAKHHFHIDLEGNFIFPNTNGVSLNFEDLGQNISADKYPYINILRNEGINGIFKYVKSTYNFTPKDSYISKCHLCHDIRSFLVNAKNIDSPDLKPVEFYKL